MMILRLLAVSLILAGCTGVASTNPYDPATPRDQQAHGTVSGQLAAPADFDRALFQGAEMLLRDLGDGQAITGHAAPDQTGRFQFDDVPASTYSVGLTLGGFVIDPVTVVLGIGQAVDLGTLSLRPDAGQRGVVTGTARLQGAPDGGHAGIRVAAAGTPEVAFTGDDGAFRLSAPAGLYDLVFSYRGYGTTGLPKVRVETGVETALPDEVVLDARPGRVRATVGLPEGFAPEAAAEARVVLVPPDAAAGADASFVAVADDGAGRFVFDDVTPGAWRLDVALTGFGPVSTRLELGPGAEYDAGRILLQVAAAADFGRVTGQARWPGAPPDACGGTEIRLVDTPYAALTGADGRFTLAAPPGHQTLRAVRPGFIAPDVAVDVETGKDTTADFALVAEPGSIHGFIALPPGYDPAVLGDARIERSTPAGEPVVMPTPPDVPEGEFRLGDVAPGRWRLDLRLDAPPFEPLTLFVEVGPAETVELGTLTLRPAATARGLLVGLVQLDPAPQAGLGDTAVSVPGTPWRTTTEADGSFALEVPAATPLALHFSHRGFEAPPDLQCGAVAPGETRTCAPEAPLRGAPGVLRGTVDLPDGYAAEWLDRVAVERFAADDEAPAPEPVGDRAAPGRDGRFVLDGVGPGSWRVRASLAGFDSAEVVRILDVGEQADLGRLALTPVAADDPDHLAAVSGTVELAGVAADAGRWGGILVQLRDAPQSTLTGPDGAFQLLIPPGPGHELVFWREYYSQGTHRLPDLAAGAYYEVPPHAVQLLANPGDVRGTVLLAEFGDPGLTGDVAVELRDAAGTPVASVDPAPDGQFILDDIAVGTYTLSASLPGYDPRAVSVEVLPGRSTLAGDLVLRHASNGPDATPLRGTVVLTDGGDPAGAQVDVRFVNPDRPFRSAILGSDGVFEVPAAREDVYRVGVRLAGYLAAPGGYGPVHHQDPDGGFVGEDGAPLVAALSPAEIDGRIHVDVDLQPGWIPVAERLARVRLEGPDGTRTIDGVRAGTGATFPVRRAGTYRLTASRPGFSEATARVEVTAVAPEQTVAPLALRLTHLGEAALDLSGQHFTAADFGDCASVDGCVSLAGADLTGTTLAGDFSGRDLSGTVFVNADLRGAVLARANLDHANLFGADLSPAEGDVGVDLRGAFLRSATLFGARLPGARLAGARLDFANFTAANLEGALFTAAGEPLTAPPCAVGIPRPAVSLTGAVFAQANLAHASLRGVDLSGTDLSSARLVGADFTQGCLRATALALTDLTDAVFERADLRGARFGNAVLVETTLRGADLTGASLVGAILEGTRLDCVAQDGAGACTCATEFEAADAGGTCEAPVDAAIYLRCACRTHLAGANLNGANLVGTELDGADLRGASFIGATFGDAARAPDHPPADCVLPPGCDWDAREACTLPRTCLVSRPRLSGARLDDADLSTLTLNHVDLRRATLRRARLPSVVFLWADLVDADLAAADLRQANLVGADLTGAGFDGAALFRAQLRETTLDGAHFDGADLTEADLTHAIIRDTRFVGATLSGALFRPAAVDGLDLSTASAAGLDLHDLVLPRALLDGAHLEGANLRLASLPAVSAVGTRLVGADLAGTVLRDADLSEASLGGATLSSETDVTGARLDGVDLTGVTPRTLPVGLSTIRSARRTRFDGLDLTGQDLSGKDATAASFVGATLDAVRFVQSTLDDADLSGARLGEANVGGSVRAVSFADASADGVNLTGAILVRTSLARASLIGARFERAGATGAVDLGAAVADGATFDRATLAGLRATDARFVGADFGVAVLDDAVLIRADLTRASLAAPAGGAAAGMSARRADLTNAVLRQADLTNAILAASAVTGTTFDGADLTGADLSGAGAFGPRALDAATLVGAHFDGRDFTGYDLHGRNLSRATFNGSVLRNTRFDGADLSGGSLSGVDLAGANLSAAVLAQTVVVPTSLVGTNLPLADLRGVRLTLEKHGPFDQPASEPTNVDLTGRDLTGAQIRVNTGYNDFAGGYVPQWVFTRAVLEGATLSGNWGGMNLSNCRLAGAHLATPEGGLGGDSFYAVNFTGADLQGAAVGVVMLTGNQTAWMVDLKVANFTGANLRGATLWGNFELARFTNATMVNLTFGPPVSAQRVAGSLADASLQGANLQDASLEYVDMARYPAFDGTRQGSHATFTGANLQGTRICQSENGMIAGHVGTPVWTANCDLY